MVLTQKEVRGRVREAHHSDLKTPLASPFKRKRAAMSANDDDFDALLALADNIENAGPSTAAANQPRAPTNKRPAPAPLQPSPMPPPARRSLPRVLLRGAAKPSPTPTRPSAPQPQHYVTTATGVKIRNPLYGGQDLRELWSRLPGGLVRLGDADTAAGCARPKTFATVGVLVRKEVRRTQGGAGQPYSAWRLADLQGAEATLLLFGDAHERHAGRVVEGSVVAATIVAAEGGGGGDRGPRAAGAAAPPLPEFAAIVDAEAAARWGDDDGGGASTPFVPELVRGGGRGGGGGGGVGNKPGSNGPLSVRSGAQLLVIGVSTGFGFCRGIVRSTGERCRRAVDTSESGGGFCTLHAIGQGASLRAELRRVSGPGGVAVAAARAGGPAAATAPSGGGVGSQAPFAAAPAAAPPFAAGAFAGPPAPPFAAAAPLSSKAADPIAAAARRRAELAAALKQGGGLAPPPDPNDVSAAALAARDRQRAAAGGGAATRAGAGGEGGTQPPCWPHLHQNRRTAAGAAAGILLQREGGGGGGGGGDGSGGSSRPPAAKPPPRKPATAAAPPPGSAAAAFAQAFGGALAAPPPSSVQQQDEEAARDRQLAALADAHAARQAERMIATYAQKDELAAQLDATTAVRVEAWRCDTCAGAAAAPSSSSRGGAAVPAAAPPARLFAHRGALRACIQAGHRLSRTTAVKRWWSCAACGWHLTTLGTLLPTERCPKCRDPAKQFKSETALGGAAEAAARRMGYDAETSGVSAGREAMLARGTEHAFSLNSLR
jgi:hypothetical protein